MSKYAVLSLSGGMDSSTLLLHLLANDFQVRAISFDYGQKHKIELNRVRLLTSYLDQHKLQVSHTFFDLKDLNKITQSNLMQGGEEIPEGFYAEDNMKLTVVPNRNKIFSSIIQAAALSIKDRAKPEDQVVIAMGIHSGDHAIYPDCRQEFRDLDLKTFHVGNWGADGIVYYTPYLEVGKYEILKDGQESCKRLGLDFDEVYRRTFTSYKPIYSKKYQRWYSDYKSGSSVERILAFHELGVPDPNIYSDETGEKIAWDIVVAHALKLKEEFENKTE
jgi:7-cyano-7-deazaguanine synthase